MAEEEKPPVKESTNAAAATKTGEETPPKTKEGEETPPVTEEKPPKTVTKDPPEPERIVPEKYDLTLPEGSLLDADAVERIASRSKELKLTAEEAQAELQLENDSVKTYVDGEKAKMAKQAVAWIDELKADKEIGGEDFEKNSELSKRVVKRFAPELSETLNTTGLGNHPHVVRMLVRIGKSMSEDQLVLPNAQAKEKKSHEVLFYGDTTKPKEK